MLLDSDAMPCGPTTSSQDHITPVPALTLDDAIRAVATWDDLPPTRRRDLASALSAVGKICAQVDAWHAQERHASGPPADPQPLLMRCPELSKRLFHRTPRAHGLSKERFANILSDLRYVLRRLGLHAPAEYGPDALDPAWRELYARLPTKQRQAALISFLRFCSREAIAPDQVAIDAVTRFERWLLENTLCKDAASRRRGVLVAWNRAACDVAGWPQRRLEQPHTRKPYTLPFAAYPAAFQADVDAFARRLGCGDLDEIYGGDILLPDGRPATLPRRRAARPTTVKVRLFQIRMAAAALVHSGVPPEAITALRDLVQPVERAHGIILFYFERSERRRGSNAGGVAEALRQIAVHHCCLPDDADDATRRRLPERDAAKIRRWAANVGQERQSGMTPKNRTRLQALAVPRTRAMLIHLPQRLMRLAEQTEQPIRAARLVLRAVAIEILLVCPVRLSNLRLLRLDQHLRRPDPRDRHITHLSLAEWETKNHAALDWPVPRESTALIDLYLGRYRPRLTEPANPYLFPGQGMNALSVNPMAAAVSTPIAREIGAVVNPHLLRHFAAWSFLKRHRGAYELVRRILGHKDIQTTITFYCGLEAEFAAEQLDRDLTEERRCTRPLAQTGFKPARRRAVRRGA